MFQQGKTLYNVYCIDIVFSAVVSIQPPRTDFTAAAAQAATGAPLLAHTPYSTEQDIPFMMPQPASYQVGQVCITCHLFKQLRVFIALQKCMSSYAICYCSYVYILYSGPSLS